MKIEFFVAKKKTKEKLCKDKVQSMIIVLKIK